MFTPGSKLSGPEIAATHRGQKVSLIEPDLSWPLFVVQDQLAKDEGLQVVDIFYCWMEWLLSAVISSGLCLMV